MMVVISVCERVSACHSMACAAVRAGGSPHQPAHAKAQVLSSGRPPPPDPKPQVLNMGGS